MHDSTSVLLDSVLETQLKFKILYFYNKLSCEKNHFLRLEKQTLRKIFLNLIYTISLKKVLSSKFTNRIVSNYFKKFVGYSIIPPTEQNKNLLELEYLYTLSINSLYEILIEK